jgi:hypothetical protein
MDNCFFDNGFNSCSILKEKQCNNCKFRKTGKEYNIGIQHAKNILKKKGLVAYLHCVNGMICVGTKKEEV